METPVAYFCPRCGRHLWFEIPCPSAVDCPACRYRDDNPSASLFGRPEWDSSDWTTRILLFAPLTERKVRLVVCAAARRAFSSCRDPDFAAALACAENWADAGSPPPDAGTLERQLDATRRRGDDVSWAESVRWCFADPIASVLWWGPDHDPPSAAAARELFANPFVPLEWKPEWFTSTARDLAAHIYAERDFSPMPILGDALMDAGCDHQLIQDHCRTPKPHARGCWAVDAVLGKT